MRNPNTTLIGAATAILIAATAGLRYFQGEVDMDVLVIAVEAALAVVGIGAMARDAKPTDPAT